MSQLSVHTPTTILVQIESSSEPTAHKAPMKHARPLVHDNVSKYSSAINFSALGINTHNYSQAALHSLQSSPATIRALANYQLNRLTKTQTKEKKIKTDKWGASKSAGKMTETEFEDAVQELNHEHSEEFKRTKQELEDILETVEKNRQKKEGEIVKTHGLDSANTDKEIKKLDKLDEVTTKKFMKDLPSLDEKPKKSFFKRLFSKSGLAILATALVGAAAIAFGVLALPAVGALAAIGFTAALAIPSIYSTVSSFIAVCNPKTRANLENIDDIRQATSGAPTELSTAKRQLIADRHEEVLKTIEETRNKPASSVSTQSGDLLAAWEKEHPKIKQDITLDVEHEKNQTIDPDIFGLKGIKKKELEDLSASPAAVSQFANHTIARQQKIDEKELSLLSRKLDGLVALGEKTAAEKEELLVRCRERQQKNMDELCTGLSQALETAKHNRALMQARDLAASEVPGEKTFDELFALREKTDTKLIDKYSKELPDLDPDKKKSTFFKRLFSWSGVKMVASLALAALAVTAAVLVPPLGIAATLGLAVSAAASSYSAISSFVAICNPKTKNVLQNIEDIRNGINGRPTDLSKLTRKAEKARHEEILTHLTSDSNAVQKEAEQVLGKIENRLDKANGTTAEELQVLKSSVQTVVNAEKEISTFRVQQPASENKPTLLSADVDPLEIDFAALGIVTSRYKKADLDALKSSPKAIQQLAERQINHFKKSLERESTIKNAKWETLVQTGKMSREEVKKAADDLRVKQAEEQKEVQRKLEGFVKTAQNNRLTMEGTIADTHGLDSAEATKRLEELDDRDQEMIKKFTKDLPNLDEKPKKSIFRKIFSKPVLAIVATALIGAAAIALSVGALPALGALAAIGLTVKAGQAIAEKTLYSSVSSIAAVCNPKTKAVLEHIDDIRSGTSGAPSELTAAARKLAADRHDEILATIEATKNGANQTEDPLAAWEASHPKIRTIDKDIVARLGHGETEPIDATMLGLSNIGKNDLKHLTSSPEAVQRLANLEIAKRQRANEREVDILTRKLNGQIATGSKTEAEKNEILDRCRERQKKDMDDLCSGLSLTLDVVRHNRSVTVAQDIADSEAVGSKKTFEELHELRQKADDDLIQKYCKDTPELDGDKKKSSFFKRLFSWSGVKVAASLALAGLAIAATILLPPLGIAAAVGLGTLAASSAYSAVSSFVAICNPNAKAVLQDIDDIRNGIHGRPTELSRMKREADKASHEEILDRLSGKKPQYQEDYLSDKKVDGRQLMDRLDNLLLKAKKENDDNKTISLSLLRKTLETVNAAEKECKENESEQDLIQGNMYNAVFA
ncbi:MAG: hypothetical protein IJU76_12685 [Desulfovibrionaceae bacterium]|nr:hypothetical protein [Desulfovibrionaceae bacterium]